MPRVQGFKERNPTIDLHLISSSEPLNSRSDDFDVAIRLGEFEGDCQADDRPRLDMGAGKCTVRLSSSRLGKFLIGCARAAPPG